MKEVKNISIPVVNALAKIIQDEILEGKQRAEIAVENEKTITYWKIGKHIKEHLLEHDDSRSQKLSLMSDSLKTLDERSKDIIQRRWLSDKKATLHELADEYQVSAERIRQIEKNAMGKMRVAFEA